MASLPPSYDHPSSGSTQEPRAQNARYHPFQAAVSRIRNAPRNGSNNSRNVATSPTRLTFPAPPPPETRPSSQLPSGRNSDSHHIESAAANGGDAVFESPYDAGRDTVNISSGLNTSPEHPYDTSYRGAWIPYGSDSGSSLTSGGGGGAGPMHVDPVDSHDVEYNPADYDGLVSHLGAPYHSSLEQDDHSRMDSGLNPAIGYNGDQMMNQLGSKNYQLLPSLLPPLRTSIEGPQASYNGGTPHARMNSLNINSFSPRPISAGSHVSSVGSLDIKRPRLSASSTREAFDKLGFDPVDSDFIWRNRQQPPNQQGMEKAPSQFLIPNERPSSALQIPSFGAQGSLTRGVSTGSLAISVPGITILPTTAVSGGAGESNVPFETILKNLNAQREINTQNPYQQQQQPQQQQPQFNQNAAAELMQGRQIPPIFPPSTTNITPAVALQLQKSNDGIVSSGSQLPRPSISIQGYLLRKSTADHTHFEQRMNYILEGAKSAVQSGNVMQMRQVRDAAVELQERSNEERERWMGVVQLVRANGFNDNAAKQVESWFSRYQKLYERADHIVKSLESSIQNIQQQQQAQAQQQAQQAQAQQQALAQQQHQNANMLLGNFSNDDRASVPYMNLLPQRIGFDDSIPVPSSPPLSTLESVTNVYAAADAQQSMEPTLEELMRNHSPSNLSNLVAIPARSYAHGGLADVYAGTFNGIQVAVKVLRIRKSRRAGARDLEASNERRIRREMHVWSALKHRNICEFLGYSNDLSDYPAMVSTWCEHGTAAEYLEGRELSIKDRLRLAQDVGDGLGYLHRLKIVHGDLKPNNVLVDDEGVAKLCDFGLVRLLDWEGPAGMTTTSPYTGTERYKAPELFMSSENRHPVATLEGDVYSMGCIMLEFIEGVYPFQRFKQTYQLHKAIMEGHAPSLRRETTRALFDLTDYLWNLLEACWGDCSARPSAAVIIDTLDAFAGGLSQGNT